jgi:cytochrome b561/polyisoprenoid-binding protein YceI
MALSNSTDRFGSVTKTFHWLMALLIFSLLPMGWYAEQLPYETDAELARKAWLFSLHKTLGVSAFFVALLRILWAVSQPKPGLLNAENKLESFAAETVHWLLYGALVIVPLSGWISHAAASGFAPIWWPFGQSLPLVPKSVGVEHMFSGVHWVATKVLIASLVLHIGGALKHHLIDRDGTLRRMLPGGWEVKAPATQTHAITPVISGVALWVIAVGAGISMAGDDGHATAAPGVALEEVASEWAVEDGSIDITVLQLGSEVSGSFAEWTSAITFDETAESGDVGSVITTVAIPSLTLGSVTDQAMGADFFDAATNATATFDAILTRNTNGSYLAEGTLTIKGKEAPVSMPFNLSVDDGLALMNAELVLKRLDFGIGASMQDESSLGFDVVVRIAVTARKGTE